MRAGEAALDRPAVSGISTRTPGSRIGDCSPVPVSRGVIRCRRKRSCPSSISRPTCLLQRRRRSRSSCARAFAANVGHALGLGHRARARGSSTRRVGEPEGMAYFNLREGRFRQTNLHLVKPAKARQPPLHRRHVRAPLPTPAGPGARARLADLLRARRRLCRVLFFYGLMHLAGVLDRRGLASRGGSGAALAAPSSASSVPAVRCCAGSFRSWSLGLGGCALDVDNEHDLDVARQRFAVWERELARVAEGQQGPLPLPAEAGAGTAPVRRAAAGSAGMTPQRELARAPGRCARTPACSSYAERGCARGLGCRPRALARRHDLRRREGTRGRWAARRGLLLTRQGRIVADLHVLARSESSGSSSRPRRWTGVRQRLAGLRDRRRRDAPRFAAMT